MKLFYIYTLADLNGSIFYIGKGTGDRLKRHDYICSKFTTPPKHYSSIKLFYKLRKLIENGESFTAIKVFESSDEASVLEKEKELIAFYGKENLCNLTDGGEGRSGTKHNQTTKNKIAKSLQGHTMSEKTRAALYNANKGRRMKPEWVQKSIRSRLTNLYVAINVITDEEILVNNITKFCKERGLKISTMRQTLERNRPALTGINAGWQLKVKND